MRSIFAALEISASGMSAQRLRLNTISSNIANADTTRTENGDGPYKWQKVTLIANQEEPVFSFPSYLEKAARINLSKTDNMHIPKGHPFSLDKVGRGAKVMGVVEEEEKFKMIYDPAHPDANEDGYVKYPDINVVQEMVNMISASRAYEANAAVINATKSMFNKAIDLLRV